MMSRPPRKPNPFDIPATYQIVVQGKIDQTWSDRLESMLIYLNQVDGEPCETKLEGELSDQAALLGVLNTLYELHLTLLSVRRLQN